LFEGWDEDSPSTIGVRRPVVVVDRVVGFYGESYRFCEEVIVWEKMRGRR